MHNYCTDEVPELFVIYCPAARYLPIDVYLFKIAIKITNIFNREVKMLACKGIFTTPSKDTAVRKHGEDGSPRDLQCKAPVYIIPQI